MFNPNTHVSNFIMLVVDSDHERFGQTAELTAHDWKEYGQYFLCFPDGTRLNISDGDDEGEIHPVLKFQKNESNKMLELQRKLSELRDQLRKLKTICDDKNFPLSVRQAAKTEYLKLFEPYAVFHD